jgi:NDP-sugar pyrophosphorylase family protein
MGKLTVILPAAGKGTRLNLPYPKEILRLDKNNALIDNSFDLFKNYGREKIQFVVIINESKTDIVKYLSKYKDKYNISFCFQNPELKEYTGAIKSAKYLFGENNIVLLPDTLVTIKEDLYKLAIKSLNRDNFTFLYKEEKSEDVLRTKGALLIDKKGRVIEYEDKPQENVKRYNAFWCSFAFKREAFESCINFMEKSTLNYNYDKNDIKKTPLFKSKGIQVEDYIDLGTWPDIRKTLSNYL